MEAAFGRLRTFVTRVSKAAAGRWWAASVRAEGPEPLAQPGLGDGPRWRPGGPRRGGWGGSGRRRGWGPDDQQVEVDVGGPRVPTAPRSRGDVDASAVRPSRTARRPSLVDPNIDSYTNRGRAFPTTLLVAGPAGPRPRAALGSQIPLAG